MITRHFVLAMLSSLFVSCVAFADRQLDRTEILQIFQKLTSQPRKTWISTGTIEATHDEYRAPKVIDPNEIERQIKQRVQEYQDNSNKPELTENFQKMKFDAIPFDVRYHLSNEYTMNSTVVVRFDGERFYWEINVQSRTDSVKPGKDLEGNFMTKQFDLGWNTRRIFAWDGEKYTTYFLPGNHAIVDTTSETPHIASGPLTAGIIPWGYGHYTYDSLCAAGSSAVETDANGQKEVHLTLSNADGSQIFFSLDPQKDYAVVSCLQSGLGNPVISRQYSGYQVVSGTWVPTIILVEQYEAGPKRLLASDLWNFTNINGQAPSVDSFKVRYETDAVVEYRSPVTDKPLMYRRSDMVDTDMLLADRLAVTATQGTQPQNCATISLKYVLPRLGKDITDQQLAQLVSEPNKTTSLYTMKEFVQSLGLYCKAVKTDIQTLKNLYGCQVILHIPGENHFLVLEHIDTEYVWTIDLSSNKFYYRTEIDFFDMDWSGGTVLLISNQPIQIEGGFTEVDDDQLHSIFGGAGYTCTRLLQEYYVVYCAQPVLGACEGYYQEYYTRYGCEAAPSGSCTSSRMLRYKESPCIEDPYDPSHCSVTGEWTCYYMRACA